MPGRQPIKFSIQIPDAPDRREWVDKVRRADDIGFYSVSVPDHLGPSLPQMAPLVALAAAAAVTDRLRLAITVLDNDFRHPVMLAKEIATLDLLSDGRVDLGLGAGWLEEDYTKTGVASWDEPGTRVSRLFESIGLLRELFAGEPVTFAGDYYTVTDFRSHPRPLQDPVPLMIGGKGKRILTFAGRHAQIVSLLATATPGGDSLAFFEEQLGWVTEAGKGRNDLTLGIRIPFGEVAGPGESSLTVADRFAGGRPGVTGQDVLDSPFVLVGEMAAIKDQLVEIQERYGIDYVTLSEGFAYAIAPVVEELSA